MSAQLELDLEPDPQHPRRSAHVDLPTLPALLRFTLRWAPVWLPAVALLQVVGLGVLPELREARELDRLEAYASARAETVLDDHARLEENLRRLADPIYRERVRRSLNDPGLDTLTLELPDRSTR